MFSYITSSLIRSRKVQYCRSTIAIAFIFVLLTAFCFALPVRGQDNHAAGNPVIIPGTPYKITPPPDWLVRTNPAVNNIKLTSPDALMWLLINAMPLQQGEISRQQIVEDTIAELVANLPAGGNWLLLENRLIDQPAELMRLQVYEGSINKKIYQLALIARAESDYIFAFYALMIPALHDTAWPMIQQTAFSLTQNEQLRTLPVTWTLHGTAPANWLRSGENNDSVSFSPTAEDPETILTITRIAQASNAENITSLSKDITTTLLNMPQAKLLKTEDITLAGVTARLIESNYQLQENMQHQQLILLPAPDAIFKIEYTVATAAYDNYVTLYQQFIATLSLDKVTIPPAEPAGELISLTDIGLQFTMPEGWKSSKNGSLFRYTPPEKTGLNGVEFTVKAQKASTRISNAAEAGRQFRMRLPEKAEVVKLLDGDVNGLIFCLTEYKSNIDNNAIYRRVYYIDLPNGMAEINCKLTFPKTVDIERNWLFIKPIFDKIIASMSKLP